MILVMLLPILFTAVNSYVKPKHVKADTPSTVSIEIKKYLYNLDSYKDLITTAGTNIDKGGNALANDPLGAKAQQNVPFRLIKVTDKVPNDVWAALAKFINDFEPGKTEKGANLGELAGKNLTVDKSALEKLVIPDNPARDQVKQTLATAISGAYERAFGATETYSKKAVYEAGKYPVRTSDFNRLLRYMFITTINAQSGNYNFAELTASGGVEESPAEAPAVSTNGAGIASYTNIDNNARYILLEVLPTGSEKHFRQVARPIILDLPLTTLDGTNPNTVYVYPKNEIPLQAAQFRKVDGNRDSVKKSELNDKSNNDLEANDIHLDTVSGATLDEGEYFPLPDAEFALFEYTGSDAEWGSFVRTTHSVTKNEDTGEYEVLAGTQIKKTEDSEEGLYTSDQTGLVVSDPLPYGKYFFVEVTAPTEDSTEEHKETNYALNLYPVYFEVTENTVDGTRAGHETEPLHAISHSKAADDHIEDWEFPNYATSTLTKNLKIVDGKYGNGPVGEKRGFTLSEDGKLQYSLKATVNNPLTLVGNYLAFYDIFTQKMNERDEDDDFIYESYSSDNTAPKGLVDIRSVFDIKDGNGVVQDFWLPNDGSTIGSHAIPQTTPITDGVPSILILRDKNDRPLGYFGPDSSYAGDASDKYGLYFGKFLNTPRGEQNGIADMGWYDTKAESSGLGWEEYGTPTGTQLYWSIDAVTLKSKVKVAMQAKYEALVNSSSGDDQAKAQAELTGWTNNAISKFTELTKGLELEFTLTPLPGMSEKAMQAFHNIGQFEWALDGDEHPYIEADNDAYVGGQIFKKVDQNDGILNTSALSTLVKPDKEAEKYSGENAEEMFAADMETYETAYNKDGQFVISQTINGVKKYLQYDKIKNVVVGWNASLDNATYFHTKASGTFSVFGLLPNAKLTNGTAQPSTDFSGGNQITYAVEEPENLKLDGAEYHKLEVPQEFLVAPQESIRYGNSSTTVIGTQALAQTTVKNVKLVPFPITGGIGALLIVVLGLIVFYIVYRYYKKRRAELVEVPVED